MLRATGEHFSFIFRICVLLKTHEAAKDFSEIQVIDAVHVDINNV